MKRFVDKPYRTFSTFNVTTTGLDVICPKCNKLGIVIADNNYIYFKCSMCGARQQEDWSTSIYKVNDLCKECSRYFRVEINDKSKQYFKVLNVHCPHCNHLQAGKVEKVTNGRRNWREIRNGKEPFFGYPLYYQTSFDAKPIWAINREHLCYLIHYIEADLREKHIANYRVMRTQSDHLPTFMRLAKNRDAIVKLLKKMLIS